jgi:hypothetical protein
MENTVIFGEFVGCQNWFEFYPAPRVSVPERDDVGSRLLGMNKNGECPFHFTAVFRPQLNRITVTPTFDNPQSGSVDSFEGPTGGIISSPSVGS